MGHFLSVFAHTFGDIASVSASGAIQIPTATVIDADGNPTGETVQKTAHDQVALSGVLQSADGAHALMCLFSHRTLQDTPQDQSHTVGHGAVYPSGIAFAFRARFAVRSRVVRASFALHSRFVRRSFADRSRIASASRTATMGSATRFFGALQHRESSRTALSTPSYSFALADVVL